MFKESNTIKNNTGKFEGSEKLVNQESKKLGVSVEWEGNTKDTLKEEYRAVVEEAFKYLKEEADGIILEISKAECVKEDDYHATIKLRESDGTGYNFWEIKITKYHKKWKFYSIINTGGEPGYNPEEE